MRSSVQGAPPLCDIERVARIKRVLRIKRVIRMPRAHGAPLLSGEVRDAERARVRAPADHVQSPCQRYARAPSPRPATRRVKLVRGEGRDVSS